MTNRFFGILIGGLPIWLGVACTAPTTSEKDHEANSAKIIPANTSLTIFPPWANMVTLQILYYNDPFGPDSLRYTRYFKYVETGEKQVVDAVLAQLGTQVMVRTEKLPCRDEGKIFAFGADSSDIKTLYFSLHAADSACNKAFFIHNGQYYYITLQPSFVEMLDKLKRDAREPVASN